MTATEEAVLLDPDAHEPLVNEHWDEARAHDAVAAIVRAAEEAFDGAHWPTDPRDELAAPVESVYFGTAGIAWALQRLGSSLDAGAVVAGALERYREAPDLAGEGLAHPPSLLMGETGILLAAAATGSTAPGGSRCTPSPRSRRPPLRGTGSSPGTRASPSSSRRASTSTPRFPGIDLW